MTHDPNAVETAVITDASLRVRVRPIAALWTAWKTTLLNVLSGTASVVLLVLGYLQTIDLSALLTPQQAIMWTLAVNVATLLLRAVGTKPIVLDQSNLPVVPVRGAE